MGLIGKTIGEGLTKYKFDCPGSCTKQHLPHDITVFFEALHAHETGIKMVNAQRRDGVEIRRGLIDYYDFVHNGAYLVKQDPFDVRPGDEFQTTCYYREAGKRTFGLGSADEMCMTFLFYYPAVEKFHGMCGYGVSDFLSDPSCDSPDYINVTLNSEDDIERTFGMNNNGICGQDEGGGGTRTNTDFDLASSTSGSAGGYLNSLSMAYMVVFVTVLAVTQP